MLLLFPNHRQAQRTALPEANHWGKQVAKANEIEINWLPEVEEKDYSAAESYLGLLFSEDRVVQMVAKLRAAAIVQYNAKDIFRASQLSLLGVSNSYLQKDMEKIGKGIGLSPLLLVRDEQNAKLVIADGYHRLCAIYGFDEDAWIHCKII